MVARPRKLLGSRIKDRNPTFSKAATNFPVRSRKRKSPRLRLTRRISAENPVRLGCEGCEEVIAGSMVGGGDGPGAKVGPICEAGGSTSSFSVSARDSRSALVGNLHFP